MLPEQRTCVCGQWRTCASVCGQRRTRVCVVSETLRVCYVVCVTCAHVRSRACVRVCLCMWMWTLVPLITPGSRTNGSGSG